MSKTELKIKSYWLGEAKYNRYDRKHTNDSTSSQYIKNQANREVRRNSKAIIQYELTEEGKADE